MVESRKFEALGTGDLFRIISNSDYSEVDVNMYRTSPNPTKS